MSKIFPIRSERNLELDDPIIVELGSEEAEVFLDALSSKTTRSVFVEIYDEPSTISDLSEEFDDSIQNIKYHVEKLEESNLVETTGTDYSEKGNEMDVYAPTNEALVLLVGTEDTKNKILDKIKPVGAFAIASVAVTAALSYLSSMESKVMENTDSTDQPKPEISSTDSNNIGVESTDVAPDSGSPETTQEVVIGFLSLPPEIALPLIILASLLLGAVAYRLTIGR